MAFEYYCYHLMAARIPNESLTKLLELYKRITSTLSGLTQDVTEGRLNCIYHSISMAILTSIAIGLNYCNLIVLQQ